MTTDQRAPAQPAVLKAAPKPKNLSDPVDAKDSSARGRRAGPVADADSAPQFLSVADTAAILAVSDDSIYDLVERGELPCLHIGRRRVIPRRAVDLVVEHLLTDFDPERLAARLSGSPA